MSAQAWIASGARVTIRTYARRYGVDWYTAHSELTALGVTLPAADVRWAVRPAPVPRPRPSRPEPNLSPSRLPPGWVWVGSNVMFPVGETDGGCAYGLMAWELDQEEGVATFGEQWSTVIEPSLRGF
ncbi:MAG: hypothetical protein JWM17_3107 [Actinobacteria bacterium]|nr:hypothetical protein [Actinomycetota bacterium]